MKKMWVISGNEYPQIVLGSDKIEAVNAGGYGIRLPRGYAVYRLRNLRLRRELVNQVLGRNNEIQNREV